MKALENNDDKLRGAYRLSSKYDFYGASLKDVYDYHIKLGSDRSHHPTLFIVAQNQNQDYEKNGVLFVNLDTDLKCIVDTCRINTSVALFLLMSLMIAKMVWENFKEDELPLPITLGSGNSERSTAHYS